MRWGIALILVLGMCSAWAPELLCPGVLNARAQVVYCIKFVYLVKVKGMI